MRRTPVSPSALAASPGRRGGVRGTGAASGPPPVGVPSTMLASAPLLVDSREVARRLAIGRTKTFQMMASGELPTVRIGRCVRVPIAALDSWIDTQLAKNTKSAHRFLYGAAASHGKTG